MFPRGDGGLHPCPKAGAKRDGAQRTPKGVFSSPFVQRRGRLRARGFPLPGRRLSFSRGRDGVVFSRAGIAALVSRLTPLGREEPGPRRKEATRREAAPLGMPG